MERWEFGRLTLVLDAVGAPASAWWLRFGEPIQRIGPRLPEDAIAKWSNQPGSAAAKDLRDDVRAAWESQFARLGEQGWELVSVTGNAAFLKRRNPD